MKSSIYVSQYHMPFKCNDDIEQKWQSERIESGTKREGLSVSKLDSTRDYFDAERLVVSNPWIRHGEKNIELVLFANRITPQ